MKWVIDNEEYEIDLDGRTIMRPMDIPKWEKMIKSVTGKLNSSMEIRVLVLETWFLTDFFIRQVLYYALSLSLYDSQDFDAINVLLPKNFKECYIALQELLKYQRSLPSPPPKRHHIHIEPSMAVFLLDKHGDFLSKIDEVEVEYIKAKYPNNYQEILEDADIYSFKIDSLPKSENYKSEIYKDQFLVSCCAKLDKEWFKKIDKLNEARNKAAHYYDSIEIYKKLKISQENGIEEVRKYCKEIVEKFCGIKKL